ncbi:MAG: ATP-binding cassette domain-containing protein [Peptostreptococcaceae bacterium]|nr:ATP-binding cassette domain-containing protein [Peptostreptococcaceae bacterium]
MENDGVRYKIEGMSLRYDNLILYEDFDMEVKKGSIVCLLGPSGCGKTTLLNVIGNLEKPDAMAANDFEALSKSYIFQEHRLLPWKTVYENVAFVIKERFDENRVKELVEEYLKKVELLEFKGYYPGELSGGMKQRVAIARAFVYPSDVLIMDEPFKGLDIRTKRIVMETFLKAWEKDKRTVVFVTHDVEEAVRLGDEIHILDGPPVKVLEKIRTDGVFRNIRTENKEFRALRDRLKCLLDGVCEVTGGTGVRDGK